MNNIFFLIVLYTILIVITNYNFFYLVKLKPIKNLKISKRDNAIKIRILYLSISTENNCMF